MTSSYNRSPVLSFYELNEWDRFKAIQEANDLSHAENRQYVKHLPKGSKKPDILPLDMFMRTNDLRGICFGNIWDGVYGVTAFSGYYIKLSKCGSECVVGYRYF